MSWAKLGVAALAASGLAATAEALPNFAKADTIAKPKSKGGNRQIPDSFKPGQADRSLIAHRTTFTATPALPVTVDTRFGVSQPRNRAETTSSQGPAIQSTGVAQSGGRKLMGLTPFGGGGITPATPSPSGSTPLGGGGGTPPASTPVGSTPFGGTPITPVSTPPTPSCGGITPNPPTPTTPVASPPPSPSSGGTGSLVTAQMRGCPGSDYSIPVNVGGQSFFAIADTGSTTFAVVSNKCTDCDGVTPTYRPGSSATDDGKPANQIYGTGNWTGELYTDTVSISGAPSAKLEFVSITKQSDWISGNGCNFTQNVGASINQGILGLGPTDLLVPSTTSYVAQTSGSWAYPAITFAPCETGGAFYVGGYPAANNASEMVYTPMAPFSASNLPTAYIAVALDGMQVNGTDLGATFNNFGYTIVDTGTSDMIFPPTVYTALASAISDETGGNISQDFFDQGECASLSDITLGELVGQTPGFGFTFAGLQQGYSSSISMTSINSYLEAQSDGQGGLIVCPRMSNSGSEQPMTLLGNTIMRNFLTVFDYKAQQVGFAVGQNICS